MKIKKFLICFLISIVLILIVSKNPCFAETENTQNRVPESMQRFDEEYRYDDYPYEDDWGYYDDYYYDDYGYGYGTYELISGIFFVGFVVVIFVIIFVVMKKSHNQNSEMEGYSGMSNGYSSEPEISESQVESKIKSVDENFSREEFLSWARDVFVKLQYAWSDRDLDIIRCFETPQLFEHHSQQIQKYIDNKQINKLEKVSINWSKLFEFKQDGSRDVLEALLNTKMIDYIINEETGAIVKGSNTQIEVNTYKLTFVRTKGVKTIPGTTSVNTTNCPNCGAPVQITSSGKCSYCGSVITTGNFNWVLSNMEIYKEPINDWVPYNDGNVGGFGTGFITGAIAGGIIREILRPRPYFGGFGGFGPRPPRRGPGGPRPGGFGGPRGGRTKKIKR